VAIAFCALVAADAQHHLLVQKTIATRPVAAGRHMTVEIKLFNMDEGQVINIQINLHNFTDNFVPSQKILN
jgi:hypothetical protein